MKSPGSQIFIKLQEIYEVFMSPPKTGTNTPKVRQDFSRLCRVLVGLESDHWSSSCGGVSLSTSEDEVLHTYISFPLLQAMDIHMMKGMLGSSAKFHEVFSLIFQTPAEPYSFVYVSQNCRHHMSCPEGHYGTQFVVLCECIFEKSYIYKVSFKSMQEE